MLHRKYPLGFLFDIWSFIPSYKDIYKCRFRPLPWRMKCRCNSKDWEKWWIDVNALIKWHKWRRYIDISRNRWVVKNYGVWLSTFNKEKKRLSIMQKWNKPLVSTGLAQIKTKAQKLNENHLLWSKRAVVMWRDEAIWLAWISSPTWTC